ncbi:MAG: hypothetical protein WCK84_08850 [Bacteroidota bacterium]
MRRIRFMLLLLLLITTLFSCNKDLKVNADWKDVTVVYGLLDQTDDTTYIKITKAFLGEGDALMFSKIADSSNYPDKLDVRLNEYADTTFKQSFACDTITIHNKQAGDTIFYYPDQLMYYTTAKLKQDFAYKLVIKNKKTGKEITAKTELVHDFEIKKPQAIASFPPGQMFEVNWTPAQKGKRYQLLIRFFYTESTISHPIITTMKSLEWIVFNDIKAIDDQTTYPFDLYFPGDAFYSVVGSKIETNSSVTRQAHHCYFIFSVAAADLNTYMEVTEPSLSLVQEKPAFTNIINGIGLFSSRFIKSSDSLDISQLTKDELKVNTHTKNLGF